MKTTIHGRICHAWWHIWLFAAMLPAACAADLDWIQTARVFLIDAYQPPFAPQLEFDAEALARTMVEMHANTVRIATMGKYATIQGVRFSPHPDLGARDVLAETIAACKPRGIRTVAYISTGHKLAWSMVTRDHPEYAQRVRPGGGPDRQHMYVGEDHGTVCWNTPYRQDVSYVAVVQATRNPPGHAQTGWFWSADVRSASLGAFAACLYGHIQVCSVPQALLDEPEKLARYRVLYLADVPQLTPRRRENLERFVRNGGGLLACYGTSLYGPTGERLERFELESLLRVRPAHPQGNLSDTLNSYRCMTGGPNDLYLTPHAATDGPLIPLGYFEPVEVLDGGSPMMDIVTGDGRRSILPGVVTSTHGQGRVVYLASSLESLYGSTRQSALGDLLRKLVEAAAATPPPFRMDAPPSLIANLTQRGNHRVMHLLNWTGDAENEANYLPPVENVTVRLAIPDGAKVRRVSTFLKAPLRWKRSGRELDIRLPRVEAYQAVSVDFE